MLIDLSEILSLEGKTEVIETPVSADSFQIRQESFPILKKEPVTLKITNKGKKVLSVEAKTRLTLGILCNKCLKEVPVEFEVETEEELDMKASAEDRIKDLDEMNYVTGSSLDVEQLLHNEILIRMPLRVLCKKDCRGLCPKCGRDLNQGSCDCEQESLDPRMAAISDIFSKFKEV